MRHVYESVGPAGFYTQLEDLKTRLDPMLWKKHVAELEEYLDAASIPRQVGMRSVPLSLYGTCQCMQSPAVFCPDECSRSPLFVFTVSPAAPPFLRKNSCRQLLLRE